MENDILIAIHQLLIEKRKPTVATVKGKLTNPAPMPSIIKVLQSTANLSASAVANLLPHSQLVAEPKAESPKSIDALSNQVATLTTELKATQQQLNELQRLVEKYLGNTK
ncbi:MAG: hypothetical protein ACPG8A_10870 [Psychrobium sp.]